MSGKPKPLRVVGMSLADTIKAFKEKQKAMLRAYDAGEWPLEEEDMPEYADVLGAVLEKRTLEPDKLGRLAALLKPTCSKLTFTTPFLDSEAWEAIIPHVVMDEIGGWTAMGRLQPTAQLLLLTRLESEGVMVPKIPSLMSLKEAAMKYANSKH